MRDMTFVFLRDGSWIGILNLQHYRYDSIHRRSALYGYYPRNESPAEIHRADLSGCWCRNIKVPTLYGGVELSINLVGGRHRRNDVLILASIGRVGASSAVKLQRYHIGLG